MDHSIDREAGQAPTKDPEASMRRMLDECTEAIAVHRADRLIYVNAATIKLFGFQSAEQIVGRSPIEFVAPRFREVAAGRIRETYGGRVTSPEIEERMLHASGREIPVAVLAIPIVFGGEPATLVHMRDLTARKELESKLAAADRLASMGFIAGGVIHQINNPLAYAVNNAELLERRLAAPVDADQTGQVRALCARIKDGLRGVLQVMRDVQIFSRGAGRDQPFPIDIHAVLDSVTNLVAHELSGRARIVKRYGVVPMVMGTPTKLGHVFANLLINAAEAIPPGHEEENQVLISTEERDGRVVVRVEDTGVGFDPALKESVFEPLVSTKMRGSGMGLAIARNIVEEGGGTITAEARVPRGSTFVVSLRPSARAEPAEPGH